MNCKKCGNQIDVNTVFCPMCGTKKIENDSDKIVNKDQTKIIVIITMIILLIVCGIYIFQSINNNSSYQTNNNVTNSNDLVENDNNKKDEDDILKEYTFNLFVPSQIEKTASQDNDLTKNIVIEEIFFNPNYIDYGSTRDVYIYGKNNNSTMVEVKVIIEYYDSEGYRIERTTNLGCKVAAGKEFVTSLSVDNDTLDYSKVKLSYEATKIKTYETEIDLTDVEYNDYLIDDDIKVLVKNNSNKKISIGNFACLYYKDNKLVFAVESSITSLEPGKNGETACYNHKLHLNTDYSNLKQIEYDNYKVLIYSAYASDSTNY